MASCGTWIFGNGRIASPAVNFMDLNSEAVDVEVFSVAGFSGMTNVTSPLSRV